MSTPTKASARAHVLVVEDSQVFREMQCMLLGQAGYSVAPFENPQAALVAAGQQRFDLVVIDYELPEMNGEQFMHELRKIQPDIAVIFVSGSLTLELAIKLSTQGVAGIFNKPANPKTLLEKINETLARHAARDTAARTGSSSPVPGARRGAASSSPFTGLAPTEPVADGLAYAPRYVLGKSDPFREFTHRLWKVRDFRAVLLLQGEAGSPFELIAREMAEISIFRDGPIMVCSGDGFEPRGLIEALAPCLLSHDAGTLVVHGIEAFTPEQQKTLENLISGRDVFLPFARRFRVVLAATGELTERVDEGTFGETLFYKISSLSLAVPSLRETRGDIVLNARHILAAQHAAGRSAGELTIAPDAAEWMEAQDWPGNHDELSRALLGAMPFAEDDVITLGALSAGWPGADELVVATAPLAAVPAARDPAHSGEARPPFPVMSTVAAEAAPVVAQAAAPASIARAPAAQLFARPAAPTRPVTAQSLFRPASASYHFAQRLVEAIATAEA